MSDAASVIEAMLLRWGESPAGRTVTFLLPDDGTQHPFKGLKTGPAYGQRVALSVALISDDETQTPVSPAEQEQRAKPAKDKKRWSELPLSQQAAIRCNEPDFQTFIQDFFRVDRVLTTEEVARYVRRECGVNSRRELDDSKTAGEAWARLDSDYRFWLQHQEAA